MLLGHNIGVVSRCHTRLDREFVSNLILIIHILDAYLVVPTVKSCKVMSDLFFVECGMNFFPLRVNNGHGQLLAIRRDLNDSF